MVYLIILIAIITLDVIDSLFSYILIKPQSLIFLRKKRNFSFDFCFDSTDPNSEQFASQETVYSALGQDILDNAFKGWRHFLQKFSRS